jgi:hypothetical protein
LICIAFLVAKKNSFVMNHVDFPGLPLRLVYTANYPTGTLDKLPAMENGFG